MEKFPIELGFKSLDPFFKVSKQGQSFTAIEEDGGDKRRVQLELPKELLALDKWLSRSWLTVASLELMLPQVSEVFQCIQVGAIDADVKRTVFFSWRCLVQHLTLLQANGEAEVLGCITEVVNDGL